MNDQAAAEDRGGAVESQAGVIQVERGFAIRVGRDIAQVADMALGSVDSGMLLHGRIEMSARGHAVVRPDPEFMNVEAMVARGQAAYLRMNMHGTVAGREGRP